MQSAAKSLLLALPWMIVAAYAAIISDYAKHLDSSLRYITPAIPRAAEDVLGLGFWPIWGLLLIAAVTTALLAFKMATRHRGYFAALAAVFMLLSAVDYYLYETLARQVLTQ